MSDDMKLVVMKNGVPVADQKAALREFMQKCLADFATPTVQPNEWISVPRANLQILLTLLLNRLEDAAWPTSDTRWGAIEQIAKDLDKLLDAPAPNQKGDV